MTSRIMLSVRPLFADRDFGMYTTNQCKPATRSDQKKFLTLLIGSVLAAGPLAAHALEAKLSGQINRALMSVDDGTQSELHNVDNSISSTRFRFTGSDEIMPGLKGGIVFEAEFKSNPSDTVTQTVKSVAPSLNERHMNVYFQGGLGTISLGQGDGAANGGTEVDLTGTSVVQWAGVNDLGGAISFRNATVIGPTITQTTDRQDFESRYDRLRYDTPAFGPVTLALSSGINGSRDTKEAALWYSGELLGGKLAGAIGMSSKDADPAVPATFDQDTTGGSISWLGSSGFSVTFATSSKDVAAAPASRTGKFNYAKLGYQTGKHAFGVDYADAKDEAAAGDEAKMTGVGYVYTPVKWAEIYAAYKIHSLDRTGANFDDITIITVGSRLKF